MPDSPTDAHARFDIHPAHSSAAAAHLTGPQQQIAQGRLTFHGFEHLDKHATTLLLTRIDHDEPYWSDGPELMKAPDGAAPEVLPTDDEWHPIAVRSYASLTDSGHMQYDEASDWTMGALRRGGHGSEPHLGRFSAQLFEAVMSATTDLPTAEGARRRARVELESDKGAADPRDVARVTLMETYRKGVGDSTAEQTRHLRI